MNESTILVVSGMESSHTRMLFKITPGLTAILLSICLSMFDNENVGTPDKMSLP